ncbi:hypothetical protein MTO96_024661 [Rhipicephalus appendiculatus]
MDSFGVTGTGTVLECLRLSRGGLAASCPCRSESLHREDLSEPWSIERPAPSGSTSLVAAGAGSFLEASFATLERPCREGFLDIVAARRSLEQPTATDGFFFFLMNEQSAGRNALHVIISICPHLLARTQN